MYRVQPRAPHPQNISIVYVYTSKHAFVQKYNNYKTIRFIPFTASKSAVGVSRARPVYVCACVRVAANTGKQHKIMLPI